VKNLVYIFVSSSFPIQKATEVAKKFVEERTKNPPDKTLIKQILDCLRVVKGKVKGISISKVKEGKLSEALLRVQNDMVPYHDLEGYEYTIKVFFDVVEALEMVGMKPPE